MGNKLHTRVTNFKNKKGIKIGRLSGIVAHHAFLFKIIQNAKLGGQLYRLMGKKKINAIVEETINQNMTLISGIPPWVQMYFEKIDK